MCALWQFLGSVYSVELKVLVKYPQLVTILKRFPGSVTSRPEYKKLQSGRQPAMTENVVNGPFFIVVAAEVVVCSGVTTREQILVIRDVRF